MGKTTKTRHAKPKTSVARVAQGVAVGVGAILTVKQELAAAKFYGGGVKGHIQALNPFNRAGGSPADILGVPNVPVLNSELAKTATPLALGIAAAEGIEVSTKVIKSTRGGRIIARWKVPGSRRKWIGGA